MNNVLTYASFGTQKIIAFIKPKAVIFSVLIRNFFQTVTTTNICYSKLKSVSGVIYPTVESYSFAGAVFLPFRPAKCAQSKFFLFGEIFFHNFLTACFLLFCKFGYFFFSVFVIWLVKFHRLFFSEYLIIIPSEHSVLLLAKAFYLTKQSMPSLCNCSNVFLGAFHWFVLTLQYLYSVLENSDGYPFPP